MLGGCAGRLVELWVGGNEGESMIIEGMPIPVGGANEGDSTIMLGICID
jgi:hypothetical protein